MIKLQAFMSATFLKKTPAQVLSCEYCKIIKKNYFQEHVLTTTFLYGEVAHDSETSDFKKLYQILWFL